jgi:ring-1,2-phenylacetyl-CoA epoxidase subunit PaaC
MHSDTWIRQLSRATEESHSKMQSALDTTFNLALGIFEESSQFSLLHEMKVFSGENELKEKWLEVIVPIIESSDLKVPDRNSWKPSTGGRKGEHTEFLPSLLNEMSEVFKIDPKAEW